VGELSSRGLLRRDLLLAFVFTGENYFRYYTSIKDELSLAQQFFSGIPLIAFLAPLWDNPIIAYPLTYCIKFATL
jgi:hypothetical protein